MRSLRAVALLAAQLLLGALPLLAGAAHAAVDRLWATEGGDKITRDDRRALLGPPLSRVSPDGLSVHLEAGRGEVIAFAAVLESDLGASGVTVTLPGLQGPGGTLRGGSVAPGRLWDWTTREIELFHVRYLKIKGLSRLTWGDYDERHVPVRFRRPHDAQGIATPGSGWAQRPDHDKDYPDIAVPLDLVPGGFSMPAASSQLIWVDVYVPVGTVPGLYQGTLVVSAPGQASLSLPVTLDVGNFTLPAKATAGTLLHIGYGSVNARYVGTQFPDAPDLVQRSIRIRDRHFLLAHRHRISLVDANEGAAVFGGGQPRVEWRARLDGSLFTRERGYVGPGEGVGNGVFGIGMYGSWDWKGSQAAMWSATDTWETWFQTHSPATDRFLFLIDESTDTAQIQQWATWMHNNPGPGKALPAMATADWTDALTQMPALDLPVSTLKVAERRAWEHAARRLKRRWLYNGARPASGSLALEDDGVAMRMWGWAQFKKRIERWFVWEGTYYNDFQGGLGAADLFKTARTFGGDDGFDAELGRTGWNYTNGDGVLFYPGTDKLFPESSLGVEGPIASLRLKYWRRGLFDHDYLTLAATVDRARVERVLARVVPVVLWEVDVDQPSDPSYRRADISWPVAPDAWEAARAELRQIILDGVARGVLPP